MSVPAADLRKLVKIVRQYEVIYGGGISSGDAAVREECEALVAALEAELGGRSGRNAASSLPSLVESKKRPHGSEAVKPTPARAAAMAELGKSTVNISSRPAKGSTPAAKGSQTAAKTTKAAPKAASAKTTKIAPKAAAAKAAKAAPAPKAAPTKAVAPAKAAKGPEPKRLFAALHLFDAYAQGRLPKYGGYIVCVRFSGDTGYAIIEIIGYENLQDIYPEGDTLVFKTVGCKLYAIVEPASYLLKSVEPVNRPSDQMVPYRISELMRITTKRFQSVLIGLKPVFMPTSFSVFKPSGEDLAVLFYDTAEVYANLQDFMIMILRDRLGVPATDSRKAAEIIAKGAREFRLWLDEA
jgi:hypothetical protein